MSKSKQILILGGGYAGLMAALRLAGQSKGLNLSITLINGLEHFVERPRLHEQATGTALKKRRIDHMLRGTGVQFLQGWVSKIEPEHNYVSVKTAEGEKQLSYHYLINALGSRVHRPVLPGLAQHAFTLDAYGPQTTPALAEKLNSYHPQVFGVLVVGGGATGIEAATQIRARYPLSQVGLVTQGEVGAFKGPEVQKHIQQALVEQAITLYEHCSVQAIQADGLVADQKHLPAEVIVWAGGFMASPLAKEAGLKVNERKQTLVDPYLRALTQANIYTVGDAACPVEEPGAPMRMSLFTALVSGATAAENIVAKIKGQPLKPLSYAWYGQGIALGLNDAVGFATYPNDMAWRLILRRKLAVNVRNFFVWYLGFVLEMERRIPGFFFWNGKKRYTKQKQSQNKPLISPNVER